MALNPLLTTGLPPSCWSVQVYSLMFTRPSGDASKWWTPVSMAVPLDQTRDQIEIYLGDTLLQEQLTQHRLFVEGFDGQQYQVVAEDIRVRLNNWPEVKASLLSRVVFLGVPFSAALALFLVGLMQTFSKTKG